MEAGRKRFAFGALRYSRHIVKVQLFPLPLKVFNAVQQIK